MSKKKKQEEIFDNRLADFNGEIVNISTRKYADLIYSKAMLCLKEYPCTYRNLDKGGLYSGAGGVAYMLLRMVESEHFSSFKAELMKEAENVADKVLDFCKQSLDKADTVSFFYGKGGLFAVIAVIFKLAGQTKKAEECILRYVQGQTLCKDVNYSITGGDELSNGRSGYILGLLWLSKYFTQNELKSYMLPTLLNAMYTAGKEFFVGKQNVFTSKTYAQKCETPLMYSYFNLKYIGTLNGLAGILQVFLSCPSFLNENKDVEHDVHGAVDYILGLQKEDGSFPEKVEDIKSSTISYETKAQWRSGSSGIIYLMAQAFRRWKTPKYLSSCYSMANFIWKKGLTKSNIGLSSGIAGNAYAFLLMHRLDNDPKYLFQAHQFADFMFSERCLRLVDTIDLKSYSLYVGYSGAVVFLIDLIDSERAEFPFMNVF